MIARVLSAVCLASLCVSTAEAGVLDKVKNAFTVPCTPAPPSIKVLLMHDQPSVQLEVKGKYRLYDPCTMSYLSTRFLGKNKLMEIEGGGLRWGEEFPGLHQLLIVPDNAAVTTVIDGKEYSGAIYVYDVGGSLSIVNELDVEEFLLALLSQQVKDDLVEEALAAMAIVGRTNAYYHSAHPKTSFWAVDANQIGYKGISEEQRLQALDKAINSTRYMVLSSTNAYEGDVDPMRLKWQASAEAKQPGHSTISINEAIDLAKKGENASQILNKAFPNSYLRLGY